MRYVLKLGNAVDKCQLHGTRWPVTLLADDDFGHAGFFAGFFGVVLVAVDEHDDVCVLLNRSRFPQIADHRFVVVNAYLNLRCRCCHVCAVLPCCGLASFAVCRAIFDVADVITDCTQLSGDELICVGGHKVSRVCWDFIFAALLATVR